MALPFSTSFVAADGTLLTAFSGEFYAAGSDMIIESNGACGNDDVLVGLVGVNEAFDQAQFAEGVIDRLGGASYTGVGVRMGTPGSGNGYWWLATPGISYFGTLIAGVFAIVATEAGLSVGDTMRIEADLTSFVLKVNGVTVDTVTDATFATGKAGASGFRSDYASALASLSVGNLHAPAPAGSIMMPAFAPGL